MVRRQDTGRGHVLVALGLAVGALLLPVSRAWAGVLRPSVLLISIDTLRPDHLGRYGYPRPTDTILSQRTDDFVQFLNAYTSMPLTLPAHTSMMTGQLPLALGLFNNHQRLPVPGLRRSLLAEILVESGYRTAAVVSSPVLASSTGFDSGFQQYLEPALEARPAVLTAEQVNERAAGVLESGAGPLFLFVHYYDVHEPFSFPDRYGCWL
ncbi:MAG: sulfatase-like hydrolase/transferase, partial [Acidobacteriota bacterium]